MAEKVVRNPNPDEIKKLSQKDSTVAKSKNKQTTKTNVVNINPETPLKPTQSVFEPEPVVFKLPSNNLVIPDGHIHVRRLTTVEEGYFQETVATMMKQNQLNEIFFLDSINKALDSCIRSNISIYDLLLIDKAPLFMFVLGLTYGEIQEFDLICEECKKEFKHKVDLTKLNVKYVPDNFEYPKPYVMQKFAIPDVKLYLIYPTIGDESVWTGPGNPIAQFMTMVENVDGILPSGEPITEEYYEDLIKNLHADDKDEMKKFIADLSEYGNDIKVKTKVCKNANCPMHNKMQEVTIPIENIFLKMF